MYAAVAEGKYGNSIPFGFERQGAPVTSFVRIDKKPIRPKTQVYHPNCIVVLEPTIMNAVNVFEGLSSGAILIVNSDALPSEITVPPQVETVATVDATGIAMETIGRPIPNTVMLGAFVRATGWVNLATINARIGELFGPQNVLAAKRGYEETEIYLRRDL